MKLFQMACIIICLCLGACGGGSGSTGSVTAAVSGVAATGAAITGTIYLKDAAGHEQSISTSDGSYSFNVSGLTAPFMLKAQWVADSTTHTLFSCAATMGTANINPLSNLIVSVSANGADPAAVYAAPAQFLTTAANIATATASVLDKLQPLLDKYQANINPISGSFAADHTGLDQLFDNIQVTLTTGTGNVSITDTSSGALLLSADPAAINSAPVIQLWDNQDAQTAGSPDVAIGSNGRAIIVWSQLIGGKDQIVARGPLDNNSTIISNVNTASSAPKIAIDGSGNAIAVWTQSNSSNNYSEIWSARYIAGSGWTTSVKLSSNLNGGANVPQVSMDSTGNAMVVWHAWDSTISTNHFDVFSCRYTVSNNTWSSPAMISSGVNTAHNPHITLNAGGNGMAVWTEGQDNGLSSNGHMDVWARPYRASGGWNNPAVKINTVGGDISSIYDQTAVSINQAGAGIVVWVQDGVRARNFTAANSWGTDTIIANNSGIAGNCYSPDAATDDIGNSIAVWQQQDNISMSFAYANRFSGNGWGTSTNIGNSSGIVQDTHIKIDGAGNARAIWSQPESDLQAINPVSNIYSNSYTITGGWGTTTLVSSLPGIDGYFYYPVPRIAMNSSGASFTVWGIDSM